MPRHPRDATQHSPRRAAFRALLAVALACTAGLVQADVLRLLVARTANESGLVDRLAESYQENHPDTRIKIITGGSMEILERGRQGVADAILSHTAEGEQLFMADGYGLSRTLIMYNQFAIFGPPGDPLGLRRQTDLLGALQAIARAEPPFLVQGERSGTRYRLLQLWAAANIRPDWVGYETTNASSPTTLATAAEFGAYTFGDLASYFSLPAARRTQLVPLVRDHRALRNDYHYLVVNPDKVPGANAALAEDFLAFLVSDRGQRLIGQFDTDNSPVPLYTPAAHLDQGLQVRRARSLLTGQRSQMYLLGSGLALALALGLFAWFTYRRARDLSQLAMTHSGRLERAVAASQEGLYEWDLMSGTLFVTPQTTALLGLPGNDAHNLHALVRQALDTDQADRVCAALQEYLNTPESASFSVEFDAADRRLELRGQASRDDAGTPLRMAGSLRPLAASPVQQPAAIPASLHDPLTGLPARQLLLDRLQHALRLANRDHTTCLVLVVGLNAVRSASVLSESDPDETLIKAVAERLRKLLRASDTLARLDDDTFVVVLAAADEQHGRLAQEKLLAGLQRPFHVNNQTLHLDSAVGCAVYPEHGQQHHSLLQRAQLAMLKATRDGQPLALYHPPPAAGRGPAAGSD